MELITAILMGGVAVAVIVLSKSFERALAEELGLDSGKGRLSRCRVSLSAFGIEIRPDDPIPRNLRLRRWTSPALGEFWKSGDPFFDQRVLCSGDPGWLTARMNASIRERAIHLLGSYELAVSSGRLTITGRMQPRLLRRRASVTELAHATREAVALMDELSAPFDPGRELARLAIEDWCPQVRLKAVEQLVAIFPPGGATLDDVLIRVLEDPDRSLRFLAAERLGKRAKDTLLELFAGAPAQEERARALVALAAFSDASALAEIIGHEDLARRLDCASERELHEVALGIVGELAARGSGRLSLAESNDRGTLALPAE